MAIHQPMKDLYLVDLDQSLEGFRNFISSWVLKRQGTTIVVDPGPRATIPVLVEALKKLDVKKIDYILLTHIHIDHAGGTGLLMKDYPDAQVICHDKGIKHMVEPAKLWAGSLKVLGKVAEAYGEIAAIPKDNIQYQQSVQAGPLEFEVLETPGHAVHHISFKLDDLLFAGEVAGVSYPFDDGLYIRLATPPVFIYEVFKSSIEKVAALNVSHFCFGHYGYRRDVKAICDTALNQLDNWMAVVEKHHRAGTEPFAEAVFDEVLKNDRGLSLFSKLPVDVQQREKYFCFNSFKGMREYFKEK